MAGATPIYGLRFQELGDAPHGPNLGGDLAADVETELARIDAAAGPVGSITMYAAAAPPAGWLVCDGSSVSRVDYADLFGVLGEMYGAGDGTTTFGLPDLRSRFPVGAGTYAALGSDEGAAESARDTLHDHSASGLSTSSTSLNIRSDYVAGGNTNATNDGAHSHNVTGRTGGSGGAGVFPHLALNFIIRAA